jgi:hypothetical protein
VYRHGSLRRITALKAAETLGFLRNDPAFFGENSSAGVTTETEHFRRCNDVTTKTWVERGSDLHLSTTHPSTQMIALVPPPF